MAGATPDFEQFLRDEVAQQIKQQQVAPAVDGAPVAPAAVPAENIKFNVRGQDYEYQTQQEFEQAMTSTVDSYQGEISRLQTLVDEQAAAPVGEPAANEDVFNKDEYIRRMDEDPLDAANYLDKYRYGTDNPVELVKNAAEQSGQNQRLLDVNQFKSSHPEFQASPQGAQILQGIMQENGWGFTYKNLEASLAVAQQRGALPNQQQYQDYIQSQQSPGATQPGQPAPQTWQPAPAQPQVGQQPQPFWQQQQQPVQAPPLTGAPGGQAPPGYEEVENLSIEQLEQVLRNAGQEI